MLAMKVSDKQKTLLLFFVIAFAVSWLIEIPLVAMKQGWIHLNLPFILHYAAAFGPALAALVVSWKQRSDNIQKLLDGLSKWKVGLGWFLFALLSPALLFGLSLLLVVITGDKDTYLQLPGRLDYLPDLGVVGGLFVWVFTFGLGEEIGWRGFALPRLQKNRTALTASLIVGVIWTFWHLPFFFYKESYMNMGLLTGFPLFLLSIIAASVVLTWLYNSTNGSLLMVILFHGLFNFFSASGAGGGLTAAIMSGAVMIGAFLVIIIYGPANLSARIKQVA